MPTAAGASTMTGDQEGPTAGDMTSGGELDSEAAFIVEAEAEAARQSLAHGGAGEEAEEQQFTRPVRLEPRGEEEMREVLDRLEAWVHEAGGDTSGVRLAWDERVGSHILAARPLGVGEPALLVPASLRLSNSTAMQIPVLRSIVGLGYAGWRAAAGALANNSGADALPEEEVAELRQLVDGMVTHAEVPRDASSSSSGAAVGRPCRWHWRTDARGQIALVLLLHHEAFVARSSSYAPYLASLPTNFEGLPLLWEPPADDGDSSGGDGDEGGAEDGDGGVGTQRSGSGGGEGSPFGEGFEVEAAILAELAAAGGEAQIDEAAAAYDRAAASASGAAPLASADATEAPPAAAHAPPAAPRLPHGVCVPERRGRRLWSLAQEVPELAGALRVTAAATRQRIHMLIADVLCRFPRVYGRGHGCALYGVAHVEALQAQCRLHAAAALQAQCDAAAAEAAAAAAAALASAANATAVGAAGRQNPARNASPAPATAARNATAVAVGAGAAAAETGATAEGAAAEAGLPVDPACTPEGIAAGAAAACPPSLYAEQAAALELEWDEAGVVTRMRWEAELSWAVAIEATRAFAPRFTGDGPTLIPLADLANHRRTARTVRAITAPAPARAAAGSGSSGDGSGDDGSGSGDEGVVVTSAGGYLRDQGPEDTPVAAVLHAAVALQAGEELHTSYHDETPADCSYSLYLTYGWVPAEEPAEDCTVLQADVVWDVSTGLTPLETARLAFARAQGLLGPHAFAWRPVIVASAAATELPAALLAVGRLLALSRDDISRCEAAAAAAATTREAAAATAGNAPRGNASCGLSAGPLSPTNEAAALQAIAAILASHREAYAAREAEWVRRGIMHRALLSPGLHNSSTSSSSSNVSRGAESASVAGSAAALAVAPAAAGEWADSVDADTEPVACDLASLLSGSPVEPSPAHAAVGSADPNVLNVIRVHHAAVRALQHTEDLLQQRLAAATVGQPPAAAADTAAL